MNKISVGHVILPNKPLNNYELMDAARDLGIPDFRGVFLRDTLPSKPKKKEYGILNLDSSNNAGSHWCCYYKNGKSKLYFDSYGIQPPAELIDYLKSPILYNTIQVQHGGHCCGHVSLYILHELNKNRDFQDIINDLY